MIADPYRELGISESATDAEVKKAYREMSKRYHPDANPDNPEAAEEKFKVIQEAYRQIEDARARGTSAYGGSSNGGYGGRQQGYGGYYGGQQSYGGGQSYGRTTYQDGGFGFEDFFNQWARYSEQQRAYHEQEESNEMRAAANFINAGQYQQALTALSGVAESARNARWYYYSAVANSGMGSNYNAMDAAKRAVDMEPDNAEYRDLLNRLQYGRQVYQQRGSSYGTTGSPMTCLTTFCMVNLCCNLFIPGAMCCI